MAERKVPRIRFKGFEEDWEQRKLSEVFTSYTDPVETPHDGYERLGIRSHVKGTFHNYVPAGRELQTAQMHRVAANKFIVNITFGWEHAVAVTDENDEGKLVSHRFPQFSLSEELASQFLKFIIIDERFRHHLWLASPGGAGRNRVLNLSEMLKYEIQIPSVREQRKVADVLISLDSLLSLHQRKLEKLKILKKAMLEKMFPKNGAKVPEIRFSRFTEDWEQRKWLDTVDISKDMVDPRSGEYDNLPHVAPGNIESFTGRLYDNVNLVKDENLISGKFRFGINDIIYGKINPQLGKYVFSTFAGLTSADAYVLNAKSGLNQKFLYAVLQTNDFFEYSVSVSRRSGMPKINRDELNSYVFWGTNENEQKQIGDALLTFDKVISLHQRKLEKLLQIKKSMLERMFV